MGMLFWWPETGPSIGTVALHLFSLLLLIILNSLAQPLANDNVRHPCRCVGSRQGSALWGVPAIVPDLLEVLCKPLGRRLTPGKSSRALNHSSRAVPDRYSILPGLCGKTNRIGFIQFSPFQRPRTLTMLHSLPSWIAIGLRRPAP